LDGEGRAVSDQTISWATTDSSIAVVEGDGTEAVVTGVAPGNAEVLAEAAGVVGRVPVQVSEPAPGEFSVSASRRDLIIGDQTILSGNLTDEGGNPLTDVAITWTSANERVVVVNSESGVARAVGVGRTEVRAEAGDRTASVDLRVRGRISSLSVLPPPQGLEAGGSLVLRASVTSEPGGYLGASGLIWSSSDPSVAAITFADADSVVLDLSGAGESVLTVQADAVEGSVSVSVAPPPPEVSLDISPNSIFFRVLEGGQSPAEQNVDVLVQGEASPSVGVADYRTGGGDWLRQRLGTGSGQGTVLIVGAEPAGLGPGTYTANIPISAGGVRQVLAVQLVIAPNPELGAVEPNEVAAREITALLNDYLAALNTKDTGRVAELFPSLSQGALQELLRLPDTDQYYLALQPGTLRLGEQEGTLEGDVMSGVVGPDGQGELRRVIYTFSRRDQGWYVVSFRAGG
jgi:hypothetical protein